MMTLIVFAQIVTSTTSAYIDVPLRKDDGTYANVSERRLVITSTPLSCAPDLTDTCIALWRSLPACPQGTEAFNGGVSADHLGVPSDSVDRTLTHTPTIHFDEQWHVQSVSRDCVETSAAFLHRITAEIMATATPPPVTPVETPRPAPPDRSRLFDAFALGFGVGAGSRSGVGVGALRGANLAREQREWERAIASPSLSPAERLLFQQQWRQWREAQESQQLHRPVNCWGTLSGDVFQWSCS